MVEIMEGTAMLSFHVLLLKTDVVAESTRNSIFFSGSDSVVLSECSQSEFAGIVEASSAEVIHIITPGTILVPEFYRAMLTTLEHSGRDYVSCYVGSLPQRAIIKAREAGFDPAQVMVKRWVYQEIGVGDTSPVDLINKVTGEYRGCEVPHMLTMRL